MDGYTVEEAASVLGVPRERVWELLARGVLSGSADLGGGMRVRLKADRPIDPPPAAPAERSGDAPPPSGDLTPFRELLTEFRSLTERYGQALLALGEARGEVAGLRSRVDMLEARADLRLPSAAGPMASSWTASPWPTPSERVDGESAPVEPGATDESAGDHADERGSHRRRARSGRRATESFADALARAEDPSPPELPGAAETAAALAGLRHDQPQDPRASDQHASQADADYSLPRELPSADAVPVADEQQSAADTSTPETGERGDGAIDEPSGHDADVASDAGQLTDAEPEDEPAPAAPADVEAEPADERVADTERDGVADDAVAEGQSEAPSQEPIGERTEMPAEPPAGLEADPAGEPAWDAEHYSAAIEEPGWISTDDVAVPQTAWASPEPLSATPEPSGGQSGSMELSGSRELDEALAALDALVHPAPPSPATSDGADDGNASGGHADAVDRSVRAAEQTAHAPWVRATPPPPLAVRSPASRAYRRLKRIFPT